MPFPNTPKQKDDFLPAFQNSLLEHNLAKAINGIEFICPPAKAGGN